MGTIEQRNKKFYTPEGIEALVHRIQSLIILYNNEQYAQVYILGFGKLEVHSKEELLNRIQELSELIGYHYDVITETVKNADGTNSIKEVIVN